MGNTPFGAMAGRVEDDLPEGDIENRDDIIDWLEREHNERITDEGRRGFSERERDKIADILWEGMDKTGTRQGDRYTVVDETPGGYERVRDEKTGGYRYRAPDGSWASERQYNQSRAAYGQSTDEKVVDATRSGYKKVVDKNGNVKYRAPDGRTTTRFAWAAAVKHDRNR